MLYPFLGPVLLASGLGFVHFSINGWPRRRQAVAGPAPDFGREDQLLGEVLTELLTLREQMTGLNAEVGALKSKRRRSGRAETSSSVSADGEGVGG